MANLRFTQSAAFPPLPLVPARPGGKTLAWGGAGVLALSALLPMPVHGRIASVPTFCPFHLLTGRPCPGCGLTRSFVYIAHGHLQQAIAYHPMGPVLFAAIAVFVIARLFNIRGIGIAPAAASKLYNAAAIAACVLLFGLWAARLTRLIPAPPDL